MVSAVSYYSDKVEALKDLFGAQEVRVDADRVVIDRISYPVLDDVIVLLEPARCPINVSSRIKPGDIEIETDDRAFSDEIQSSFGAEWQQFSDILDEYVDIFQQYFDIVPDRLLDGTRIIDLGCGTGRWSYFLRSRARQLVLVDFSEAIFVARKNLVDAPNTLFFLGDVTALPFRNRSADFAISLGVLHHLPVEALAVTRQLSRLAPSLLIYLYYALDNRPLIYRMLFALVNVLRKVTSRVRNERARNLLSWLGAAIMYQPLVLLGKVLKNYSLSRHVPLYEGYRDRTFAFMRQDCYDRFFTGIEQRFSRDEILSLSDTFSNVTISDSVPYWPFLCANIEQLSHIRSRPNE